MPLLQVYTLSRLPVGDESVHVYLNGVHQRQEVDWSRQGLQLSIRASMSMERGDSLEVRYATLIAGSSELIGLSNNPSPAPVLEGSQMPQYANGACAAIFPAPTTSGIYYVWAPSGWSFGTPRTPHPFTFNGRGATTGSTYTVSYTGKPFGQPFTQSMYGLHTASGCIRSMSSIQWAANTTQGSQNFVVPADYSYATGMAASGALYRFRTINGGSNTNYDVSEVVGLIGRFDGVDFF